MSTQSDGVQHADHYAIVLGLSRYPRLGDPPPADLYGPENDAAAIVEWLTNPHEGGLPPDNVRCIVSKDVGAPPDARPTRGELEAAFLWLDSIAGKNQEAGRRRRVGSRLYLYASGHGFSPGFRRGCLLAGDAAQRQYSANVFPSAWIDWLQDADYFREFVLWMDCCMDRQVITQPSPPPLDPISANNAPPGPSFIAFGASRPLKALEKAIPADGNKVHGIFTWNLLQGLRGAAANKFGAVTGRSLADWTQQSHLAWLDEAERASPDVAKEPAIVDQDEALVFARGVQPFDFEVTLRIAGAVTDQSGVIWSGLPPQPGAAVSIPVEGVTLRLKPGLYLAEVAALGLRHGFAVVRSGEVWLSETGPAPRQSNALFALNVDPGDPTCDIRLMGDSLGRVDAASRSLSATLPFGLYQLRIRVGRQIVEKVILLDKDWPEYVVAPAAEAGMLPALPLISSAAPLPGTRTTRTAHEKAVAAARQRVDVTAGSGAELMIMARAFSATDDAAGVQSSDGAAPWGTVTLRDGSGNVVADLASHGQRSTSDYPFALCSLSVAPGSYVLEHSQGTSDITMTAAVAQPLVVPPGWRLEVYLMTRLDAHDASSPLRVSLLMRRMGVAPGVNADDLLVEKARVALADERLAISAGLIQQLGAKPATPLAGIIGAHLLILECQQHGTSLQPLDTVVQNLRALVGADHPDVEALSLMCTDAALRAHKPFVIPPLYERSWRLMVAASQSNAALVPLSLWDTVHAMVSIPPFFMWLTDVETRRQFRDATEEALFAPRTAPAVAPKSPAAPLQPAAAVSAGPTYTIRNGKVDRKRYLVSPDEFIDGIPMVATAAPLAPASSAGAVRMRDRNADYPPAALAALKAAYTAKAAATGDAGQVKRETKA